MMQHHLKTEYSEQQIMEALLKKDQAILCVLYDKYALAVFGLAYRITGSKTLSEHILQKSFHQLWNTPPGHYPFQARAFTRLLQTAGNLAREAASQSAQAGQKNKFTGSKPEKDTFVPAGNQSVIDLIYIQGLNLTEAAASTGYGDAELKTRLQSEIGALKLAIK